MRLIGVYCQTSGSFVVLDEVQPVTALGYSGRGAGLNNTTFEHKPNLGPVPRGRWLVGEPHAHSRLGPLCMTLFPHGHSAQGRSDFMIHGDNGRGDRSASKGCIVVDRDARTRLAALVKKNDEVPYILVVR